MLEYNFNKLDNDFITLWSNWILYHDTEAIIKPLTRLAEMGQINAIQCYYLIKKDDEHNEIIDNQVNNFYGHNFNEALAIANKMRSENIKEIKKLEQAIADAYDDYLDFENKHPNRRFNGIENPYEQRYNDLLDELSESPYGKQVLKAGELTLDAAKSSKLAFIYERFFEIVAGNPLIFGSVVNVSTKSIMSVRKALIKRVKTNNGKEQALYCLGKNLLWCSKPESKNERKGSDILRELAQRELSINKTYQEKNLDEIDLTFKK